MSRVYGHDKTIHRTEHVHVELCNGQVVAVWFRCQPLPFEQCDVGEYRADEMIAMYEHGAKDTHLLAVEVSDATHSPHRIDTDNLDSQWPT